MALASRAVGRVGKAAATVALLGIISAALFYGDAVITPALSVLSAIEGIDVATPAFHEFVVPLTVVDPAAAVCLPVARHRARRGAVRPDHDDLVCRHRHTGLCGVAADPGVLWALNPFYGVAFLHASRHDRTGHARRGVSRRDRGRSALCRSRSFRPRADPARVVPLVLPALAINYLGQGALVYAASGSDRQSVLSALSRLGAHPDGGPGDDRHRDREPGGDYRRLFADQPGDPARLAAAVRNPPHLGAAGRPDLHAAGQRPAACLRAAPGRVVPLVERARFRLRHRRDRHHGGDRHDGLHRHLADLALVGCSPPRR